MHLPAPPTQPAPASCGGTAAADAGLRTPLLPSSPSAAPQGPFKPPSPRPPRPLAPAPAADVGPLFARRACGLLRRARAWPALALVPAAAAEAWVVSNVGAISGRCYAIFVDGRRDELGAAMAGFAALYAAAAAFFALKAAFCEWLALDWRRRLGRRAHWLYCVGGVGGCGAAPDVGPMAPPFFAFR
ncbi:hypothetical protein MNEG_10620, partial [Monoraphidium neglectum]